MPPYDHGNSYRVMLVVMGWSMAIAAQVSIGAHLRSEGRSKLYHFK